HHRLGDHRDYDRIDGAAGVRNRAWRDGVVGEALQDFSSRQILHQSQVGLEEIKSQQLPPGHPSYLAKNSVLNFTLIIAHFEEAELHRPSARVFMDDAGD